MSIVDNKTVDGIALTDDNNGIILLIADHMDWRDEYQHLVMLQEKINVYITFLEQKRARLIGEHRSLCIYSMVHRGTPEKPGLVLGLDRGGACQGVAFRVAAADKKATIAYLREREQVTSVYREVMRSVWLESDARKRVRALAYVADRSHDQYAGRLTMDEQLRLVRQGHGAYGPNDEYVIATVTALEAQGVRDAPLQR